MARDLHQKSDRSVAIIGMACRFPMANDPSAYYHNLENGVAAIRELSPERWSLDKYYAAGQDGRNKSYSKWCGQVEDIDKFDNDFFNISPREAAFIDPQQRILLEEAWHCIEDAGIPLRRLREKRTAVFVGAYSVDYLQEASRDDKLVESFSFLGGFKFMMANRISYFLGLTGKSLCIDTACSSSLVAVHEAVQALLAGECDYALVGGANLSHFPFQYITYSKARMLSRDGKCKTFDSTADGFVTGEGIGVVLLQRSGDAEAEKNNIYGHIKGTAVNHGGRAKTATSPSVKAQKELLLDAYENAGFSPETITYVEAHGTGTSLGDPIEVKALTEAFRTYTDKRQFCRIGSVKTNIGHLVAAAGIAGLIKVMMMLKHRKIVPSLHVNVLNPLISFEHSPFQVAMTTAEWEPAEAGLPLRAGISSFGAGGANAHIVVEAAAACESRPDDETAWPFLLSARTPESLLALVNSWRDFARTGDFEQLSCSDIAHTLCLGREPFRYRCGTLVHSRQEIRQFLESMTAAGVHEVKNTPWCMWCGENNYHGFPADSIFHHPAYLSQVQAIIARLSDADEARRLQTALFEAQWQEKDRPGCSLLLDYCLLNILSELGLQPGTVSGEGNGLLLALAVSGMLSFDDAYRLASGATAYAKVELSRPSVTFRDPLHNRILQPLQVNTDYLQQLLDKLLVPPHVCAHYRNKAQLLYEHQFTFKKFIEEWKNALAPAGMDIIAYLREDRAVPVPGQTLFTICIYCALLQLYRKWDLEEEDIIGNKPFYALVKLAYHDLVRKETLITLLLPQPDLAGIAAEINQQLAEKGYASREMWEDFPAGLPEIPDFAQWYTAAAQAGNTWWPDGRVVVSGNMPAAMKCVPVAVMTGASAFKEALLQCWLAGLDVHWRLVMSEGAFRKVSLPVYAFEKKAFWLPGYHQDTGGGRTEQAAVAPVLPPLQEHPDPKLFYLPVWKYKAAPAGNMPGAAAGILIIAAPAADNIVHALQMAHEGNRVDVIKYGEVTQQEAGGRWQLNAGDPEALAGILDKLQNIGLVYFLGGIAEYTATDPESLPLFLEQGLQTLFRLVKHWLQSRGDHTPLQIKVITNNSQAVVPGTVTMPYHAGIRGLCKGIARELKHIGISCMDVDLKEFDDDSLALLCAALIKAEPPHRNNEEVAFRNGNRYQLALSALKLELAHTAFRNEGIYIIIGGAGGIGLELTHYLTRQYKARVIIVGRRPPGTAVQEAIDEGAANGGQVRYQQADVTDMAGMHRVVEQTRQQFGRINGVIHSALAMRDKPLAEMSEDDFVYALRPKVEGSLVLYKVLEKEPLDFLAFFSSAQSLTVHPNLSNYAAACTFKDACALYLAERAPFPVKLINWGFWETKNVTQYFQKKIILRVITPQEGLEAIERIMASPVGHVMAFKAEDRFLSAMGVENEQRLEICPQQIPSLLHEVMAVTGMPVIPPAQLTAWTAGMQRLQDMVPHYLLQALTHMGISNGGGERYDRQALIARMGLQPKYERLLGEMLRILGAYGMITQTAADIQFDASSIMSANHLATRKNELLEEAPAIRAYIGLLAQCMEQLPEILTGEIPPTTVLFANANAALVEGIYRDNLLADHYNRVVATVLHNYVKCRAHNADSATVRILEVGAGTGSTSGMALSCVQELAGNVSYVYTDISKAFIQLGRQEFNHYGFVEFKLLNIENDPLEQDFSPGEFDVVIATNVLHATRNLPRTLSNIKKLLKTNGWLILNEMTGRDNVLTMTFGLLDGWWLYEDDYNRVQGTPLVSPDNWSFLLRQQGFGKVTIHGQQADGRPVQQHVIIAESDGLHTRGNAVAATAPAMPARQEGAVPVITPANETSPADKGLLKDHLTAVIRESAQHTLNTDRNNVDIERPFSELGIDSILGIEMVKRINDRLQIDLRATVIYDYATVAQLSGHILDNFGAAISSQMNTGSSLPQPVLQESPAPDRGSRDIAVIGMSGRFPGADTVAEFWANISAGLNAVTEIPRDRWDIDAHYDADRTSLDKTYSRWGGFVRNKDHFDAMFFNISGKEAELSDPQHRLFLEECYKAFEDAGYAEPDVNNLRCGVFVGATEGDYDLKLMQERISREAQSFWGNDSAVLAARIAYFLNLKGPAITINTACSSSLVAIHLACQHILSGESEMAVAGGVFVTNTPNFHILASNAEMLSPEGKCKTFDNDADGFVLGEGVGAIILKPLDKALSDHDHIYGVIKASGINQDGKTNGIAAPSALSQAALEMEVYKKAGIDPGTIGYIEAHGTGTKLGDPIEITALSSAFRKLGYTGRQTCAIGSVKTNIGHAANAAGIAGVIKVLLSLQHRKIAPSLHFNRQNEHIDFAGSPFYVSAGLQDWRPVNGAPLRRAAVSSFGVSGTNGHIVIEEAPAAITTFYTAPWYLIPLSAKTRPALSRKMEQLRQWLAVNRDTATIADIAYTLQVGRTPFRHRAVLIVRHVQELADKLETILQGDPVPDCFDNSRTTLDKPLQGDEQVTQLIDNLETCRHSDAQVYKTRLVALAGLWLREVQVNWRLLYKDELPQRISLPVYPLAGMECIPQPPLQAGMHYYHHTWQQRELPAGKDSAVAWKHMLLFDTDDRLFNTISAGNSGDAKVWLVLPGAEFSRKTPAMFQVRPSSPEDHYRLMECLASEGALPETLVHCWAGSDFTLQQAALLAGLEHGLYHLCSLLQALKRVTEQPVTLLYIYPQDDTAVHPQYAAVTAFAKSVIKEDPSLRIKTIAIGKHTTADARGRIIAQECLSADQEVRYAAGKRWTGVYGESIPPAGSPAAVVLREGAYIITGGAGGIGRIFARYLAERTVNSAIYLVGRSSVDPARQDQIAALSNARVQVRYIQADVSDFASVQSLVRQVNNEAGPVRGVIHAAGIISDALLVNKSREEMANVLAPKIWGAVHLHNALQHQHPDFFVTCSSLAAVAGNAGQSDYAYASSFLDHFMAYRQQTGAGGKSVSVNWPLWQEGGMRMPAAAEKFLTETLGIKAITAEEGICAFQAALNAPVPALAVLKGEKAAVAGYLVSAEETLETPPPASVTETAPQNEKRHAAVCNDLLQMVAGTLRLPPANLDEQEQLGNYGFDSLSVVTFINKISVQYHIRLSPSIYYRYSTVQSLATFLLEAYPQQVGAFYPDHAAAGNNGANLSPALPSRAFTPVAGHESRDIAVIGMDGIFPGSPTLPEFWRHLAQCGGLVREVPADRWDWRKYEGDPKEGAGKTNARWGAFIDNVDRFDAGFFNISPLEAGLMDPQHRLFLQTAWKAVEDAGYMASTLSSVGVFVGASFKDYQDLVTETDFTSAQATTGNDLVMLANRVSFLLNFNGPSEVISTACSSSLVALNRAVRALQAGECTLAIAGGVSLMLTPENMLRLSQLGVLSADGKCKTFDKDADGIVKGEGVGALLLKPLQAAIADGDRIYGVIKGSTVNHGGKAASMTAPNIEAQADLLATAYRQAGIDISTVTYMETHGTGTKLGDPAEVEALKLAFGRLNGHAAHAAPYCGLGSIKHNIGHLEPAAGIAGVIKVLLCMRYGQLPGLVHFREMNPFLQLEHTPFYLVKTTQPWERLLDAQGRMLPRRAGVSSFGYGGTNAHVVLEEYLSPAAPQPARQGGNIILLSARETGTLKRYAAALLAHVKPGAGAPDAMRMPGPATPSREQVANTISAVLSAMLAISAADLDAHVPFRDYGVDSNTLFPLLEKIAQAFRLAMEPAAFAACTDLDSLADAVFNKLCRTAAAGNGSVGPDALYAGEACNDNLHDMAFTLQTGREAMQERIAVVVSGKEELCTKLEQFIAGNEDIPGLYKGSTAGNKALAHLIKGKRGDAFIREVIADNDLGSLAALWTEGAAINWSLLYTGGRPQKIALPTYPFAGERHWVPVSAGATASSCREGYYKKIWEPAPVTQQGEADITGHIIVLVNSYTLELATRIFEEMTEATVTLVEVGAAPGEAAQAHYLLESNDAGTGERAGAQIAASCPQGIRAVIDLSDIFDSSVTGICMARTALLQTLMRHYLAAPFAILHFTGGLVRFKNGEHPHLAGAGLAGLVKMLGAEYAQCSAATIDIDNPAGDVTGIRAIILRELHAVDGAGEVCYRAQRRYLPALEAVFPPASSTARLPVSADKVLVITGGVRGIGLAIARHLVARGSRKLVLMGREALPPKDQWEAIENSKRADDSVKKKIAAIAALEQQGADVAIYCGSLEEPSALGAFFEHIREAMGPVHGVIHCAGAAFNDNPAFISKTCDELRQTASPKIEGLHTLHALLGKDDLDFFILCSSVSALVPYLGAGASIYAAANAYMDHFAAYQHAKGNRYYRSVQWPNWQETGMGVVKSDAYLGSGFTSHTTAQGLDLLEKACACNSPVIMAGYFDQEKFAPEKLLRRKYKKEHAQPVGPAAFPGSNDKHTRESMHIVRELLSGVLRMPAEKLHNNSTFAELGVNSIILAQLVVKLEPLVGGKVAPSAFFEYPTVSKFAGYLDETFALAGSREETAAEESAAVKNRPVQVIPSTGSEKIAVIGIGCNFPCAPDKITYWHNLKEGRNCVREIPTSRWSIEKHYASQEQAGKSISKWGAFLDDIEYFDPGFFKISPAEAPYVDPLIRQFLEVSIQALRDAGYEKEDLWNRKASVFVGARVANFSDKAGNPAENNPVGMGQNFIAAYASHVLNFRGPNLVVDTACSSSLVSIHLACQSLLLGESEVALAGGVDILLDEKPYLILSKAGALSPDGRCFTFDERANGFVPGEGAGAVLLKPFSKAVKDGDMIYAVIDASAVNNDGHTMGVTTPNPEAQQEVIEEALLKGNIDPATITYIEAHGTGTLIGDPIELKALTNVFRKYNAGEQCCAVGTVKSNMGHLLSAAGIAGFIKVALGIHHRMLVPTINCEIPNPRFRFEQSPFYPNTALKAWDAGSMPLRAGISAFGFGGTNAHIILSEPDPQHMQAYRKVRSSLPPVLFRRQRYWIGDRQPSRRQLEITRVL